MLRPLLSRIASEPPSEQLRRDLEAALAQLYREGRYRALDRAGRAVLLVYPGYGLGLMTLSMARTVSDVCPDTAWRWRRRWHCASSKAAAIDDLAVAALRMAGLPEGDERRHLRRLATLGNRGAADELAPREDRGEITIEVGGRPFRYWLSGRCPDTDRHVLRPPAGWLDLLPVLRGAAKPGMRAVDVGANVGLVTVFLAGECSAGHVLAIEPNPATAAVLRRHLEWNATGLPVEVGEYAVGRDAGTARLLTGFNSGGARLAVAGVEVPVKRLDDVVDGPVDLIKVDVEGREIDVLLGAVRLLREARPLLFVEAWPRHKRRLVAFLAAFEYRVAAELPQDMLMVPDERLWAMLPIAPPPRLAAARKRHLRRGAERWVTAARPPRRGRIRVPRPRQALCSGEHDEASYMMARNVRERRRGRGPP